jgi:cytochrome c oxidase cbb3-type subunit I/II
MTDPASPMPAPREADLDTVTYDDRIVLWFLWASLIFGVIGMLVGVLLALQLALPAMNFDLPWTTYGRIRPLHTNAVIFAFAGNAIFAGFYYATQRLLKARMWNDKLSWFHFWGWQSIILSAAITLPLGLTSSKEYAELIWPIDIAIAVVWVAWTVNTVATIMVRRERHLYVAIWFLLATQIGVAMLHVVNSLSIPTGLTHSYSVFSGVQDALVQWWYGHNAVAFFLTTPFLGLMYYYLPKAAERPVYSYRLSIIHFWSLIFLYIWSGPHHLLNQATPEWAQTLGVAFSIMLLAPSWGGMINGLLTLRGAWDRVRQDPVLKFWVAAVTFYGMATFEGPLLSLRTVNALSHNSEWTIGHVHGGAMGWNGLIAFALAYWLIPKLYKTKLHSTGMANLHFWTATVSIFLYMVALWIAGVTQGLMTLQFNDEARLMYPDWMEIVRTTIPFYWLRVFAGFLYLSGIFLCIWNVVMTVRRAPGPMQVTTVQVPRLTPDVEVGPHIDAALDKPTVREKGNALHALVERWPTVMIVLITISLVIGGLCEIVPQLIQGAVTPRIASIKPYTPLELAGRDIYIREGCVGCHTQMVRTLRAETERYRGAEYPGGASYTRAGETIYDRPFLWGSKRTGPDLWREGGLRNHAWHWAHMEDPTSMAPDSTMPRYRWLYEDATDYASLPRKLAVLAGAPIYTPYSREERENCVELAKAQAAKVAGELRSQIDPADRAKVDQDKEIIALIAYLQRLGTDLSKSKP